MNLPGYYYSTVGPDSDPRAIACPQDTFQVGLRKQRGCVSCPVGMTTANRTMQTNIGACGELLLCLPPHHHTAATLSPCKDYSACTNVTQFPTPGCSRSAWLLLYIPIYLVPSSSNT